MPLRGVATLALAAALGLAGCTTYEHARSSRDYLNRCVAARTSEGAERLRIESEYDGSVRDIISSAGQPDYLCLEDRFTLYFFYMKADRAYQFKRTVVPFMAPTTVKQFDRIPGFLVRMLPNEEQKRMAARRAREQRIHKARAPKPRRRAAAPAARAPSGYLSGFDVSHIVSRMREPMTAADAGVSDWRSGRLSDGTFVRTAEARGLRYEVQARRVTVVAPLRKGTRITGSGRLAIARLNRAVFGMKGRRVTQAIEALATQVAADRTGKTRLARRIEGRTVSLARGTGEASIVYAIHSN